MGQTGATTVATGSGSAGSGWAGSDSAGSGRGAARFRPLRASTIGSGVGSWASCGSADAKGAASSGASSGSGSSTTCSANSGAGGTIVGVVAGNAAPVSAARAANRSQAWWPLARAASPGSLKTVSEGRSCVDQVSVAAGVSASAAAMASGAIGAVGRSVLEIGPWIATGCDFQARGAVRLNTNRHPSTPK